MEQSIKIFKTDEITPELWDRIILGFNEAFGTKKNVRQLVNFYKSNVFGYSFHAIKFSETGDIMGYNSFVPSLYEYNGKTLKVVNSGGSFVLKEFRKDIFIFKELFDALLAYCKEMGYDLEVGVPNKNSFRYAIKINKSIYVGDLAYYILPVNISKIINKSGLKAFDFISRMLCRFWAYFNCGISYIINFKETLKPIRIKIDEPFLCSRFRDINKYNSKIIRHGIFFYRIYDENGIKTAYVMDFRENGEKTSRSLSKCIFNILKYEQVDAIIFVGTLNLLQSVMLKVPKRFVPQKLPLVFHLINPEQKELELDAKELCNWDFSLINFDVR